MTRKSESTGPFSGAGKWLTALITTGAALAALLVNAKNLGVSQWLGLADYAARRVWVLPRVDTLRAIGDTTVLAATVTDERGAGLTGVSLRWQTSDATIATVDSAGTVVARGPGTARIRASVRELSGESRIVVRQLPVRVAIQGDTAVGILEGDTVLFVAHTLDARNAPILELAPRWRSDDTSIVTVDSMGRAIAHAPGWVSLSAEHRDLGATLAARVELAPASITLVSGGDQRMPAGRQLPLPIVVRVLSRNGTPIPDIPVAFTPADGEGTVAADTVTAGRDGQARATWTLSDRPGSQRLVVTVPALDSALLVTAEADPHRGNTYVAALDTALTGVVGDSLSEAVVVRVSDSTGTAIADVPVAWTALDRGAVESEGERTDSLGQARARWTLGPRAGPQRLRVQVGNPRMIPPVTVTATARPGPAARVVTVGGEGQSGTVGAPLAKAVIIGIRDAHGNGVPGVPLSVRALEGTVTDTAPRTDSTGHAAIRWDLGRKAGPNALEVRAAGLDSVVRATARARPGTAANVAFEDPPARATAGTRLRLRTLVTDAYGNPVPNAVVVFSAPGGTLTAARVATDTAGRALTRWTPGSAAREQTLTATVRGTAIKAIHAVPVTAPTRE
jgi:adhesin/invasin